MKSIKRVLKTQPSPKKKVIELEIGGGLGRWMNSHHWGAMTIPLPLFTLIMYWSTESEPDGEVNSFIRVHEFVHVKQNEGDLFWGVSWVRYLWESVRHLTWKSIREQGVVKAFLDAYYANAFEKEAYMVEELAEKNGLPDWAK